MKQPTPLAHNDTLSFGTVRASATLWSLGGRVAAQLIQVAGFVVLSRLVAPAEFGVVAAAAIFTGFAQIFTELGVGSAVVAQQRLTDRFLATSFWINLASGLLLAAVFAPLGLLLSHWLGYPSLRWVLPLTGLSLAMSFSAVNIAILERQFKFRTIALLEGCAALCGQVVAVSLALQDLGLLGLSLAPTVSALTLSLVAFPVSGWRPRLQFGMQELRNLQRYALPLIGANSVNYWARSFDDLLVSKVFGAATLGFYSRSYQLMLAPVMQATLALGRVYQATFAAEREVPHRLELRYRVAEGDVALFGFVVSAFMVVNSSDVVALVFGDEWEMMGTLLTIFALSIGPQVITSANGALLRATGDTRLLLRLGLINSVLLIGAVSVAAVWSVEAIAWTFVAHAFVVVPLTLIPVSRRLNFDSRKLAGELARVCPLPLLLYAILSLVRQMADTPSWAGLAAQLCVLAVGLAVGAALVKRRHSRFEELMSGITTSS